jgi:RNA polymerase sigma factor (sigma-70 family)
MLDKRPLSIGKLTNELDHIIEGCIRGRRSDQERLYRLFSAKMFGVCLRYCRDSEEAKDILQDGFLKVFDKIKQFEKRGSLEGWIRRIMVNISLERCRKNSMIIHLEQFPEIKEEEENTDKEFSISMNELLEYVQKLPTKYRMVFNLYVFEEMSHKEIAESMGISEGTSKSDLSRARGILQNQIKSRLNLAKIG